MRKEVLLFQMLGYPGSGKSYVAAWLAPHMQAVHLQSDAIRLQMFGPDRLELHRNPRLQKQVRDAMQYATRQILVAGHSVLYDANHTAEKHRQPMRSVAKELGAVPIIVWVKVPLNIAKERVLAREAAGGAKVFEMDFIDRMARNLEPPAGHERAILLDGLQTAEEQRKDFDEQLTALLTDKVQ